MDSLYLPYLADGDTIQFALERMKQTDNRALIVEHVEEGYRLYMNRQVVEAWRDRAVFCSELLRYEGRKVVPVTDPVESAGETYLWQFVEQNLDKRGAPFGLLFLPRPGPRAVTLVVTRHEGLAYGIRDANKVCACKGNRHIEESPPAQEGESCNICGSEYECY